MGDVVHGHVTDITTQTLGDELAAAAGPGALDLVVLDVADFDASGGTLRVGGDGGAVYGYQWVDDNPDADTGLIRLSSPLAEAALAGDVVDLWDPSAGVPEVETVATVVDDTTGDPIEATVDHKLLGMLAEQVRGLTGESVICTQDDDADEGDVWRLTQVLGKPPVLDGATVENPLAKAVLNTTKKVPTNIWTAVTGWTATRLQDIEYDAPSGSFLVNTPGSYIGVANVTFEANDEKARKVRFNLMSASTQRFRGENGTPATGGQTSVQSTAVLEIVTVPTQVWVEAYQNTGAALDVGVGPTSVDLLRVFAE